jgi:PAS domain S-box-containing protein
VPQTPTPLASIAEHQSEGRFAWPGRIGRDAALGLIYLMAYLLLDRVSFVYPYETVNITPWNPPPALSLVLMLVKGLRWAPLALVAPCLADLINRPLPDAWMLELLADFGEMALYGFAAWLLRGPLRINRRLVSLRDVVALMTVTLVTAVFMAFFYVGTFWAAGWLPDQDVWEQIFKYWVGDTIGVLVTAPLLLVHRRSSLKAGRAIFTWETLGQLMVLGCSLWLLLFQTLADGSHVFFMMFVPLVWVAAKHGLPGVTLLMPLTQLALILGTAVGGWQGIDVTKLQFLMLTLTIMGLLLGVVVSERERARHEVIRGEARLGTLIDLAPDGLLVTDERGRIEMVNRLFESMSGLSRERVLGKLVGDLIAAEAPPLSSQPMLRRSDGSLLPVEVSTASVPIAGRHSSVVSVRDISQRKMLEERRKQRRSSFEQTSRVLFGENMAASLAHELNQPLAAMIGYTASCRKMLETVAEVPPRLSQNLEKAIAQAERAGGIVGRLLEFFRAGRLQAEPVPIADLIDEVVGLLADDALRLSVQIEVAADPHLMAWADRLQVEQVLVNLLRNSLEAVAARQSADKLIRIEARRAEAGLLGVSVSDNGPGIPDEVSTTLFDPFVTTRAGGMGLGLAISQSIISAHGGRIWCEPAEDGGVTFRFTLPIEPGGMLHASN